MDALPSLNGLRVFEAVARNRSFALASDELGLTPSAVSHRIRALETELRVKLFHRRHRGIELTDTGRSYVGEVRAALQRLARASAEVRDAGDREVIRLHSAPSFASQWLMPRLAQFVARHPEIDLRLTASADSVDFTESLVDVDIRYGRRPSGDLAVLPLPAERISPLCRPDQVPTALADLQALPLIHSERCLVQWAGWCRLHHSAAIDLGRGLRFDRSFMAIAAACDGLGIALESSLLAEREVREGRLVAPWPDRAIAVQGHFVVMPKPLAATAKVRVFLDWLEESLAGMAAA